MASLGIQVIVLPGREIAAGATFAPRITVERNLPTGRYRLTQTLESF
jgi:bifunctional UDP-N-acetylglucosamine pyrophosphorylase/glucosamine-1-phosphate N-acetyltransferase